MTITYVAASAAVTGNNASLSPTRPTGTISGDVVFIAASIRSSGTGVPATPSGWTRTALFGASDNVQLFSRVYDGAWSMPTVTFTGGAAGDDTLALAFTVRGADVTTSGSSTVLNSSAQNVTLPTTFTPSRYGSLAVFIAWKQDDWTSLTAPTGATAVGTAVSTAGNDAAMAVWYAIQTTPAATPTGALTVTGGASAISRAGVVGFQPTLGITVQEQDVYPPRALITVSPLTDGDAVEIDRSVAGERTPVRASSELIADDPNLVRVDAELPFGVPVTYIATVNGVDISSSATTYVLPGGGKVALSDAINGNASEVVIQDWPSLDYDRQASVFKVGGRNVVVSSDAGQFTGTIDVYTETTSSADNLLGLLRNATENTIQIRQGGGYDGVDSYVSVLAFSKKRFASNGSDQSRMWTLSVAEVEGWADALEDQGFTLQDIADAYTGQTLADLAGDYPTLIAIAQGDFS